MKENLKSDTVQVQGKLHKIQVLHTITGFNAPVKPLVALPIYSLRGENSSVDIGGLC